MILFLTVLAIALAYTLYDAHTPTTYKVDCDCGEYDKCPSTITYSSRGGISRNDLLECEKVRKQIRKCKDL